MKMDHQSGFSARKILKFAAPLCSLVNVRAKQAQDDKPLTHQEFVRPVSVNAYALWSQPSLRRHRGMKVSATRPQLSRLSFARSIPARPFGLGLRFDEAPSGSAIPFREASAPEVLDQAREGEHSLAHPEMRCKRLISVSVRSVVNA